MSRAVVDRCRCGGFRNSAGVPVTSGLNAALSPARPSALPADRDPALAPVRILTVLIATPTLEAGAADEGTIDLAAILTNAGHRVLVASRGGRLEARLTATGAELIRLDMASCNPVRIARNAATLRALLRKRGCDIVHAHGRAAAWSALAAARMAGIPFLTTWHKGYREQNALKRLYNGVMARGERVIAPSEQIAELIVARHGVAWERITVIPAAVDLGRFDPTALTAERIGAARRDWGVKAETKVILVPGRMLRRKGHHVAVQAARRLKGMGLKNFLFVFAGEDQGRSRYSGELWDLVLATGTADVVRIASSPPDVEAAYGAATAILSAAIQPEGLQRSLLEALAMARPVVVSDLAAGRDIVQAPPTVAEERMTGLRVPAGDDAALAAAMARLLSMPDAARRAIGRRGREWVASHCAPAVVANQVLAVYAAVTERRG
jgi:glycosyltransferase involved in cell wall biosynthesis